MPWAEIGGLQLGQVWVAQAFEGLILAQHCRPVLEAVGDYLSSQRPSAGLLPALPHHTEAAPDEEAPAKFRRTPLALGLRWPTHPPATPPTFRAEGRKSSEEGGAQPAGGEGAHLRIWVWKVKVWELGRGWVGRAGLLSSSEAVGREAGDWGAPHSPSSPHLVSHRPFPGTLKRGLSSNPHLVSFLRPFGDARVA